MILLRGIGDEDLAADAGDLCEFSGVGAGGEVAVLLHLLESLGVLIQGLADVDELVQEVTALRAGFGTVCFGVAEGSFSLLPPGAEGFVPLKVDDEVLCPSDVCGP